MSDIATPDLVHVADVQADVSGKPIDIGDTPHGYRRIIPIVGGKVGGPRLNGRILPGGADFQYWHSDGGSEVHARYVVEADTGGHVYVENTGVRRGTPDVMTKLKNGEAVDPALIYFRTVARFETTAPDLVWLTRSLFICSGMRFPDRVVVRIFQVA